MASRFKEVWISGNSQQMADVQRMLKHAAEEADGHRVIGRHETQGRWKTGGFETRLNQTSRGCRRWNTKCQVENQGLLGGSSHLVL